MGPLKPTVLAMQGQQQPRMQHLSPEGVAHLSQNKLLPLLLQRALAANESNSIRLGHAVDSVQQSQQGVSCNVASEEVSKQAARGHHHVPSTMFSLQPSQPITVHFSVRKCRRMPQRLQHRVFP